MRNLLGIAVFGTLFSNASFAEEPANTLSDWLKNGYSIVSILVADDREKGMREIYLQRGSDIMVCHISTAGTYDGGAGVKLGDCFIVDV